MAGESWMIQRDPQKAVASFERALEVNPQNYYAHERLADLHFGQNEYASAYYHLQRYLRLSKDTNYVLVQRLNLAGLRLAQQYADQIGRMQSQGDVDAWKQRYLDASNQVQTLSRQLAQLNASVTAQSRVVVTQAPPANFNVTAPPNGQTQNRTDVTRTDSRNARRAADEQARTSNANLSSVTHHVGPAASTNAVAGPSASGPRKHVVKSGETPAIIAKRYGISLNDLMTANPHLDARRMKVGMEVNIPAR